MMPAIPAHGLARGRSSSCSKHLFEPRQLVFGLGEVVLERVAQLIAAGGPGHLRQRAHELFLGMIEVAQFVDERVVERLRLGHECRLPLARKKGRAAASAPGVHVAFHRRFGRRRARSRSRRRRLGNHGLLRGQLEGRFGRRRIDARFAFDMRPVRIVGWDDGLFGRRCRRGRGGVGRHRRLHRLGSDRARDHRVGGFSGAGRSAFSGSMSPGGAPIGR